MTIAHTRCRYSQEGIEALSPRIAHRDRLGFIISETPKYRRVRWDGRDGQTQYARQFIEPVPVELDFRGLLNGHGK